MNTTERFHEERLNNPNIHDQLNNLDITSIAQRVWHTLNIDLTNNVEVFKARTEIISKIKEDLKTASFNNYLEIDKLLVLLQLTNANWKYDSSINALKSILKNPGILAFLSNTSLSGQQKNTQTSIISNIKSIFESYQRWQIVTQDTLTQLNTHKQSIIWEVWVLQQSTSEPVAWFFDTLSDENIGKTKMLHILETFKSTRTNLDKIKNLNDPWEIITLIWPIINSIDESKIKFSEIEEIAKNTPDPQVREYFEQNSVQIRNELNRRKELITHLKSYYELLVFEYNYWLRTWLFEKDSNGNYKHKEANNFIDELKQVGSLGVFINWLEMTLLDNIKDIRNPNLWIILMYNILWYTSITTYFIGSIILLPHLITIVWAGYNKLRWTPENSNLKKQTKRLDDLIDKFENKIKDPYTANKLKNLKKFFFSWSAHTDIENVFERKIMQAILWDELLNKWYVKIPLDLGWVNKWLSITWAWVRAKDFKWHPIYDTWSISQAEDNIINRWLYNSAWAQLTEIEARLDRLITLQDTIQTEVDRLNLWITSNDIYLRVTDMMSIESHQARYVVEKLIERETDLVKKARLIKEKETIVKKISNDLNKYFWEYRVSIETQSDLSIWNTVKKIWDDGLYWLVRDNISDSELRRLLKEWAEDFKTTYANQDIQEVIFRKTIEERLFSTIDTDNHLFDTAHLRTFLQENLNIKTAPQISKLLTQVHLFDQSFIDNKWVLPKDFDTKVKSNLTSEIESIINNKDLDISYRVERLTAEITELQTNLESLVNDIKTSKIDKARIDWSTLDEMKKSVEKLKSEKLLDSIKGDFKWDVKDKVAELIIKWEKITPENTEGIIKKLVEIDNLFQSTNPRAQMFIEVTLHHMKNGKELLEALTELHWEIEKVVLFTETGIEKIDIKLNAEIENALIASDSWAKINLIETNLEHVKTIKALPDWDLKNPDWDIKTKALAKLSEIFFANDWIYIIEYVEKYNDLVWRNIPVETIDANFDKTTLSKIETSYIENKAKLDTAEARQHELKVAELKAQAEGNNNSRATTTEPERTNTSPEIKKLTLDVTWEFSDPDAKKISDTFRTQLILEWRWTPDALLRDFRNTLVISDSIHLWNLSEKLEQYLASKYDWFKKVDSIENFIEERTFILKPNERKIYITWLHNPTDLDLIKNDLNNPEVQTKINEYFSTRLSVKEFSANLELPHGLKKLTRTIIRAAL